ncbi:MAG: monofunctional biosynthetic peptidoglycan transglycosylase [Pseudomonadota bacterium]
MAGKSAVGKAGKRRSAKKVPDPATPPRPLVPRRSAFRRLLRALFLWPLRIMAALVVFAVLWVAAYRVIDPPGGVYMAQEWWRLGGLSRDWRDLEAMSPEMARAVVAAEDARFCQHYGLDFEAIEKALEEREAGGRLRGASTLTQQVAKNVFLWHGRSFLRKGLEAGFALTIEVLWPKHRIVEVYLNVAEFGPGVFGAEAAAQHHFGRGAEALTLRQASRLAAALPNPKERDPGNPGPWMRNRAAAIAQGAETLRVSGSAGCLESL